MKQAQQRNLFEGINKSSSRKDNINHFGALQLPIKSHARMIGGKKGEKVAELIAKICHSIDVNDWGEEMTHGEVGDRADEWGTEGEHILTDGGDDDLDTDDFEQVEEYFKDFERKESKQDNAKEFEMIEDFVHQEQISGRRRRETARLLSASEEVRISADIAELKKYRSKQQSLADGQKLHSKISDTEKSHASRKLAIAKAAQVATSDCRKQFKRVRDFFQELHDARKKKLKRQYERSLKIQSLFHRLRKTDTRVRALERNTAERIFRKKESDMDELNMVQNLEEATYLERIISLLDDVQESKEDAADAYFQLQIKHLRSQQDEDLRRSDELSDARAQSMLEMAETISKYVKEEFQDREDDEKMKEHVESTERKKDFQQTTSNVLLSVSDLYDTILWSVATGSIGLSSSDTDSFDSYEDLDDEDEEEEQVALHHGTSPHNEHDCDLDANSVDEDGNYIEVNHWKDNTSDTASVQSGSTANTSSADSNQSLSPVGHMFVKKLRREMRAAEKAMEKQHAIERKKERRLFRAEARKLKQQQQAKVDRILARCVDERHKLRDAISHRMKMVEENQNLSTQTLQEAIDNDVKAMQSAWHEHKRLEEEQKTSFAKAQALISAQVFHEVRNALSSVVAMSEMTSSLQKDPAVSSETLVDSVSEMLDQNKEVVNYSLNMLNNILDVSKIKAGSFETKKGFFDLQDLVNRATTMQLVKAQTRGVKMTFTPMPEPQIAYTDEDIVVRIITNFISNAVKFTTTGAVQPFICPLEKIDPSRKNSVHYIELDERTKKLKKRHVSKHEEELLKSGMKLVAIGVADTGPGLSKELLNISEAGLFSSESSKINSGAKNSGFGLHLAHQLAGTLGSSVNLADLDAFEQMFNLDMSRAVNGDMDSASENGYSSGGSCSGGSCNSSDFPGKGTVLYITIPVLVDGCKGKDIVHPSLCSELGQVVASEYKFSPRPSPSSPDGCFRILVADDVPMLRKGLMRSVLDIFTQFSDCPISVSTACTAEDALRAVDSLGYDLFICDNQFAPPSHLNRLFTEQGETRKEVHNQNDKNAIRKNVMEFFNKEAFTIAPGDGSLSGLDALLQLASSRDTSSFPVPLLVLHSGHQLELPPQIGVIVVRKPLKRIDFLPLFERNASNLINTGMCREIQMGDETAVFNRGGAQLFKKRKDID